MTKAKADAKRDQMYRFWYYVWALDRLLRNHGIDADDLAAFGSGFWGVVERGQRR